ncbi:hypothetical protein DFJ77DRAFT_439307 [Powellomyces hirtus]|nr:hypothetical protein DFJ77DRAFT_439307 [Powellomyces hirtus]
MGNNASSLEELVATTNFSAEEIQRLYKRFVKLDKGGSGLLTKEEFLSLPQIASNPLGQRLLAVFDNDGSGHVDFKKFIQGLSAFSTKGKREDKLKCKLGFFFAWRMSSLSVRADAEQDGNGIRTQCQKERMGLFHRPSPERLLTRANNLCTPPLPTLVAFKVYDMDRDGYISNGELFLVLKMMVGNNLKDNQLQQIVDKTIMEADLNTDGKVSFEEFQKMVEGTDVAHQMTLEDDRI